MPVETFPKFKFTWEEAIEILRDHPTHHELIFNAYLTRDLHQNANRFKESQEFTAVLALISRFFPNAKTLLDMPGGNGIATHAFASVGFEVTTVEPNPSDTVGRGAIAQVLLASKLHAEIVEAWGEELPFEPGTFDIVYVRQGLHHSFDLPKMLASIHRVLRPSGILIACREHVVDNYGQSLKKFLASQVDHQLYGGENAFTLRDYRAAIQASGLAIEVELGPFDSIINAFPNTPEVLSGRILNSAAGRVLAKLLPARAVVHFGVWCLKRRRQPGRLYTFLARKPVLDPGC